MSINEEPNDPAIQSLGVFCDLIVKLVNDKADELRNEFAVQIAALRIEMERRRDNK